MKKNYKRQLTLLAKCVLFIFIFQCFTLSDLFAEDNTFAESVHKVKIDLNMRSGSVNEVFALIEQNTYFRFAFDKKDINNVAQVFLPQGQLTVAEILQEVAKNSALNFKQINNTIYVKKLSKKASQNEIEVIIEDGKAIDTQQKENTFRQTEDIRVSGKVSSQDDGQPMPGVNISIKGEARGTVTDVNGDYSITVPEDAVLVFSFMGYVTEEILVNSRSVIDLVLVQDISQLDEIVVIGYGETKKRDLTGSVASIKSDEILLTPTHNAVQAMQGRVAGLDIVSSSGQAGAQPNITIRGNRSINGSNSPLYIIDGFMGGSINDIHPNDIESIEVLKDASTTAIYGSQGANGVIIVTTKRGKEGKSKISYNGFYGVNGLTQFPEMRKGEDYINLRREAIRTGTGNYPTGGIGSNDLENEFIANDQWVNWPDLLINNGTQQSHNLSISGGSSKTKIFFSGGYFKEEGMLKGNDMTRYSARFNVDHELNKWAKAGFLGQVAHFDQNYRSSPLADAITMAPFGYPYDEHGNINQYPYPEVLSIINPLVDERGKSTAIDNSKRSHLNLNGYLEFTPIDGLKIRSNFGTNIRNNRRGHYFAKDSWNQRSNSGVSRTGIRMENSNFYTWDNIISYNKELGNHSFTVTGVSNYTQRVTEEYTLTGENQPLDDHLFHRIGATEQNQRVASSYIGTQLLSFAGRLNYSYRGKYLLTLSNRYDGASMLSPQNRWASFPSVAGAWVASDEAFLSDIRQITLAKVRLSYGVAGNAGTAPYSTQTRVTPRFYSMFYGDESRRGIMYEFAPMAGNAMLGWELSATTNLGFDFGFFNNRLTATVDLYNTNTTDILLERPLPTNSGMTNIMQNVGSSQNRGVEAILTSKNIDRKDFSWTTSFTFTRNREKITGLIDGDIIDDQRGDYYFIGHPVNSFYNYRKLGIWQTHEADLAAQYSFGGTPFQPGDIKLEDLNDDKEIDPTNDRMVIGSEVPSWIGGIQNTFRYKAFDFGFFVFARWGQMIEAQALGRYNINGSGNGPSFIDYWTPENPTNDYPRPNSNFSSITNVTGYQTLNFVDGSFIKVRNVTLGYTLPKNVSKKIFVENLRVYATGNNLFSYSKSHLLREFDPEVGSETFPLTRQVIFGVNIDF